MNQKQLTILKQGVKQWNLWRRNNPHVKIDLSGIDLTTADEAGLELWNSAINRASLNNANLAGADLTDAELSGVNLTGCNLTNANLTNASLWEAIIKDAKLCKANITGASLIDADLSNTDVTGIIYKKNKMHGLYRGVRVDTCFGAPDFRADALDQRYVETVKEKMSSFLFWCWGFFTDYGRSVAKTAFYSFIWMLVYALIFYADFYFFHSLLKFKETPGSFTPMYFSIMNFFGAGGEASSCNTLGEVLIVSEVVIGYFMLGMLITVLVRQFLPKN